MEKKILIIEDEPDISNILKYALTKENFTVRCAYEGCQGLEIMEEFKADLIILDVMLPDISGFQLCRTLGKYNAPIIMVTARNDIVDKILGLELGADDYITKPFDIREVIARVNVAIRRKDATALYREKSNTITIGDITIFKNMREVKKGQEIIKLKPKEYELLLYLFENKDIVLSREKILEKVWDYSFEGDWRTVDVHIRRIRQKLGQENFIETIFGIGYLVRSKDEDKA